MRILKFLLLLVIPPSPNNGHLFHLVKTRPEQLLGRTYLHPHTIGGTLNLTARFWHFAVCSQKAVAAWCPTTGLPECPSWLTLSDCVHRILPSGSKLGVMTDEGLVLAHWSIGIRELSHWATDTRDPAHSATGTRELPRGRSLMEPPGLVAASIELYGPFYTHPTRNTVIQHSGSEIDPSWYLVGHRVRALHVFSEGVILLLGKGHSADVHAGGPDTASLLGHEIELASDA